MTAEKTYCVTLHGYQNVCILTMWQQYPIVRILSDPFN